jgi:hypothetical protein
MIPHAALTSIISVGAVHLMNGGPRRVGAAMRLAQHTVRHDARQQGLIPIGAVIVAIVPTDDEIQFHATTIVIDAATADAALAPWN